MMDYEEGEASRLHDAQVLRWESAGKPIGFYARPEEIEINQEIVRLRKMSASYQRKYGSDYPFRITKDTGSTRG